MAVTRGKFIAVPNTHNFILSDYKYWAEHIKDLDQWCRKNMCVREGMTVTALNDYARTLFLMKWS